MGFRNENNARGGNTWEMFERIDNVGLEIFANERENFKKKEIEIIQYE